MHKLDDMRNCIEAWLEEYRERRFVRFSIIDKQSGRAVGTVEFFTRKEQSADLPREAGILRLDLISGYEQPAELSELLELVESRFGDNFAFNSLLTKAVPQAAARISVLQKMGYTKLDRSTYLPFEDYYIKVFDGEM
jgi:hypothetical protein